ncbi:TetR/AcrR family transcriptional regulator [Streptomyces sp. Vc74B-19]|uniref:TetR/AcrR family transcriptional regulator n=1 Tax=unclassified Streptomyces TaxID=2593676 RepID=UPI001BFC6693|nr:MULTISPECIES: TetR/AcrR family transcriptional regulator [unclassified Streptomyces]MBT3166833.1 TetR/AcrR family transcriptional regulator [Streptomyces sp. Vc74B-19]MCO4699758.1 TetR/AcrR family transcriptional regulator [Streptomyces sp. RO-S4]MDU0303168.1 TetR/AcrR family transcriptional regulator [Streptomyces sp. PAL114]
MVRAAQRSGKAPRPSVWLEGRARGGGRGGRQPSGLDRERITEATVRLLDAEGLATFSMRRLAAELDVTAMSVYWYVDTKDDLLELALDRAFGELALPDPESGEDWRDDLRALARGYRALLVRHPWLSELAGRFLNIGPNALRFSGVIQQIVGRSGLPEHGVTGAISAVFQFVYGYGTIEGHFHDRVAATGLTADEYHRRAMNEVTRDPDASDVIGRSARIMEARGGDTVEEMLERDFTFALDLLVAGIETMVARSRG